MKTLIRFFLLLLFIFQASVAFCAAAYRPSQAALTTMLKLPVVSSGTSKGFVEAPAGTTVWVLQVRRTRLYVDFSGAETWIKRSNTDYDQRVAAHKVAQRRVQDALQQQAQARLAAQPPMQHNAGLDVQAVGGGGGGRNFQNAAAGYYLTAYSNQTVQDRRTVLKVTVRNFNTRPDHLQLQCYFFAKPAGNKPEFIFDTATKDLWLKGGEFRTFQVASTPVSTVVSQMLATDYYGGQTVGASKSGSELKGWMARVTADGRVLNVKGSGMKYRDLANNEAALQQMQTPVGGGSAYPAY